jgi:peptidase E
MKTKFLLHGGQLRFNDERNSGYFQELTKGLKDGDKVLFVGFARLVKNERQQVFEQDSKRIVAQSKARVEVVNATHEDFLSQLKEAKAVHITGGMTTELVEDIRNYPEFEELIKGKTIGGSSAGACLLATYYLTVNAKGVRKGLGLLPVLLKVHADGSEYGDMQTTLKLLDTCPKDLERIVIDECAWVERDIEL